jgi:hypothetical protein
VNSLPRAAHLLVQGKSKIGRQNQHSRRRKATKVRQVLSGISATSSSIANNAKFLLLRPAGQKPTAVSGFVSRKERGYGGMKSPNCQARLALKLAAAFSGTPFGGSCNKSVTFDSVQPVVRPWPRLPALTTINNGKRIPLLTVSLTPK